MDGAFDFTSPKSRWAPGLTLDFRVSEVSACAASGPAFTDQHAYDAVAKTCKKRRQVEVFHTSLKSNVSLAKSPTQTVRTHSNHGQVPARASGGGELCITKRLEPALVKH